MSHTLTHPRRELTQRQAARNAARQVVAGLAAFWILVIVFVIA